MPGVILTRVGYAGGKKPDPTYHSLGDHMESIQVDYDPEVIGYGDLLEVFRRGCNPFGKSYSRQYALAVFYHTPQQKEEARAAFRRWEKARGGRVAAELLPADSFHPAEAYHQKYRLQKDAYFMAAFRRLYPRKTNQALVQSTLAARLNGYLWGLGSLAALSRELADFGLSQAEQKRLWAQVKGNHPGEGVTCPIPPG